MKSPIYFDKCRGSHIDLSQLAEVGPVFGIPLHPEAARYTGNLRTDDYSVGFRYRFNNSPDWQQHRRQLREGPRRNEDLTLVDPSEILLTAGEEFFEIVMPHERIPNFSQHKAFVLVHHEKLGIAVVKRNMEAERLRLINAWKKWKSIEPEIYAIIRKHMS